MEKFGDKSKSDYEKTRNVILSCQTPEQLKVTEEFTVIGVASALHVELPKVATPSPNGESFYVLRS